MEPSIQGRVFKFGDNINSDVIIPGRYLIYIDAERLSQHAFEVLGEDFPAKLRNFDILVAGRNFGCGSAREQAVTAIAGLGIKAVIACSFARTFYRNAINAGMPIVECPELYPAVAEGDSIRVDLTAGRVLHHDGHREQEYRFPPMPEFLRELLERGGLAAYLKAQIEKETSITKTPRHGS